MSESAAATVFDPASEGWSANEESGFIGLVGPLWQKFEGEDLAFGFLAEDKHHNLRGVVQGGMIMTFADRALGSAARHSNQYKPQATIQLDVHFIDAVQVGEFVTIRPRVVRRTRSIIFMEGTLTVGERVVANAKGIWKPLGRPAGDPDTAGS